MIFFSAQPDELYFLWQIKLLLFNFNSLGIPKENIHVLIGFNLQVGLNAEFKAFITENSQAEFYTYADTRESKNYVPSLRPHIIAKHFLKHPELESEVLFYHDSDIVFSKLPDFNLLSQSKTWFTSDTSSYLNTRYIINSVGEMVFEKMCQVVGISPTEVKENDLNAGGAQYIIKDCPSIFWQKMERDCEIMFPLLEAANSENKEKAENSFIIQSWCTDMWVLWWNALKIGKKFEIHSELDFSCVYDPIDNWAKKKILHYTGSYEDDPSLFLKGKFTQYEPFYEDFSNIRKNTCSYALIQLINQFRAALNNRRTQLRDVAFLILLRVDSKDRLDNFNYVLSYLNKWFNTNIYVMEVDSVQKMQCESLPTSVNYEFVENDSPKLYRALYFNKLILKCQAPIICLYDVDVVFPIEQILKSVNDIRIGSADAVSPYGGSFKNVDKLSKIIFSKVLDALFFDQNQGKYIAASSRSYGGALFIKRSEYIRAGMENMNITGWGPDDVERVKRLQILGYKVKRTPGNLYHLTHARLENSGYKNADEQCGQMEEYLKICMMDKKELRHHIKSWQQD